MSLKAKLVSTIAAFCMVICLLSVGIWAASNGTVTVGGSVSFTAEDVNVEIALTGITGTTTSYAKETIVWDATDGATPLSESWTGMDFTFERADDSDALKDIVIKITVTNKSTERDVKVTFTKTSTDAADGDVEVTFATEGETTIAKGGAVSKEYTITLHTDKTANDTVKGTSFTGTLKVENVANV